MRKTYAWFGFWMLGLLVAVARTCYHLQSGASAWRLLFDALLMALFAGNSLLAWRKAKAEKGA